MMFGTMEAASIAEALKTIREGTEIIDCTNNGECSNCGGCCSNFLPVTPKEIESIRQYIECHGIKPQKHFIPSRNPVYDMICRVWNCRAALNGEQFDMTPFWKDGMEEIPVRETFFGGG